MFFISYRITLATIGLSWLVIGTSAVGLLPNGRSLPNQLDLLSGDLVWAFYALLSPVLPRGHLLWLC